jgi:hypothetical protein
MATSKSAWTRAEASLAALFGARRRVLSGSSGRADIDGDDGTHERLWLESKLRASHAVYSLWRATKAAATKAGKIPVLGLREKHKHGALIVIHEDDLKFVIAQYLAVLDPEEQGELDHLLEQARIRRKSS